MSATPLPTPEPEKPTPQVLPSRPAKSLKDRFTGFTTKWILGPLLGALIAAVLIGRLVNFVIGPSAYKVYIIGNISDPETSRIVDSFAGNLPKLNGVPVEIRSLDDSGDPDTAQRISTRLASLRDSLLVVGHLESTPTQKALPAYLQVADPPIPVILTTETNPSLLPPTVDKRYLPVFRLSPTDNKQAEKAAEFVLSKGAKGIWVVEDTGNPIYSRYLAREFVARIHQNPSAKVLLWSTNYNIPPAYAISSLGIDWVFFAGEWQKALVLIRQLRAIPATRNVNILLTDWCVDARLLQDGGPDVENVYLTHPLSPAVYNHDHYGIYGSDAFDLVRQILTEADQDFDQFAGRDRQLTFWSNKILGFRRISDARIAIGRVMESAVLQKQPFTLSGGTQATFAGDGTRGDADFQVWQVRGNSFQ